MKALRIAPGKSLARGLALGGAVALMAASAPLRAADDPYAAHIAQTEPLSPEQERAKLHVPEGFEIQLVAAEPDIGKPLNIAFDHRGRLWVSETYDYPFPQMDASQALDGIMILEDTDGDGRADVFKRFAGNMTHPIGLLPTHDGVISFSIPKIYKLTDTDGDDVADKKEELYGTVDRRDTHGLVNSFRWGFDGWIYLTHGFSNTSEITGGDGSSIVMNSGNTFRIRADGSRVEQFTWGQVNPFGLSFDRFGNLYSADCHTKPVYQLLRGAYYPSFGKPHDGLGFAPLMCKHDHGSTSISGVTYYEADHFPPEYRDTVFMGNSVTSRVNCDRVVRHGSTPEAVKQPDFIRSDDPWFRPVDVRLGPDGALYIADFYNRIIGHYEVPLTHPGRDRRRGRIWRVVYTGPGGTARPQRPRADWSVASVAELIEDIGHANLEVRTQAANQLVVRISRAAVEPVREAVASTDNAGRRIHGLWVLERLGALDGAMLRAAASATDAAVRVHAQRIVAERKTWSPLDRELALAGVGDADALVQRTAAEALGQHPSPSHVRPLLDLSGRVSSEDTHLRHMVRMALRNQFHEPAAWAWLAPGQLGDEGMRRIVDVAPGLATPESATFLFYRGRIGGAGLRDEHVSHVARYLPAGEIESLVALLQDDRIRSRRRLARLEAFVGGMQQRGTKLTSAMRQWASEEVGRALSGDRREDVERGMQLVRSMRFTEHLGRLAEIATSPTETIRLRRTACEVLILVDASGFLERLGAILGNADEPSALREHVARLIGNVRRPEAVELLTGQLRTAAQRMARVIAGALASSPAGAERLLTEIEAGKASAHLLIDRRIHMQLDRAGVADLATRMAPLTEGLPEPEERIRQLMRQRKASFANAVTDVSRGAVVFEKTCSVCHQIGDVGKKLGPELAGIGMRGLDRILEDTLDPNRTVDQAFRSTLILLEGGVVISGLLQDDQGEVIVLADAAGNLVSYPKDEIVESRTTNVSPMPSNIAEDLPEQDFHDLLAFLLAQRQTESPKPAP